MKIFLGKSYDEATKRESSSLFIARAAFWFAAFRFLTHDITIKVWGFHLSFGKMDAALLGAFLLPCLSLYFGRRLFPGPQETGQPKANVLMPPKPPDVAAVG